MQTLAIRHRLLLGWAWSRNCHTSNEPSWAEALVVLG